MSDAHDFEARNTAIQNAIASLPDWVSEDAWGRLEQSSTPSEVLVHAVRVHHREGRVDGLERATELLIGRAYPIAEGIVRRTLLSRPQDREDAVRDALAAMWGFLVQDSPFWERNFVGAFSAVCISTCRKYLAKKRVTVPFADLEGPDDSMPFETRITDSGAEDEQDEVIGQMIYERALSALDSPLRDVVRLLAEEELSQRQIASRLGCTEKTVYNRLAKIRDQLAGFFQEEALHGY